MLVQQPSNQIKLTNVSIVRLKKGGKRFEIACYKNKVQEWRSGVETDLDDVLQIANVFMNVSKGEVAKSEDLSKAFGTSDIEAIVKEILKKGELQVGEKERAHELDNLWKEIAAQVAEKCVDPSTGRPYSVGIIEKAMREAGFSVETGKPAKSQVSKCIKLIQTESKLPLQRARMRIRVVLAAAAAPQTPPVAAASRAEPKLLASDGGTPAAGSAIDSDSDDGRPKRGKGKAKARQRELEIAAASLTLDSDSDDGRPRKGKGKKAKGKQKPPVEHDDAPAPAKAKKALPAHVQQLSSISDAELRKRIVECAEQVEKETTNDGALGDEWEVVMLIDPASLKTINDLLQKESRGRGRTETLALNASA
ncbi:SBDS-domain-containing protein [Exidia glandulosa HHB12029]|uniref:Ribosome maturation protein SDO1 n=1 Tax=Exidia glandulosa HHB12029 TaxID=1314781 RepID=A0A166BN79_EXIGL|nr:SBDS-domain-containing protein [Exidia glandulosa HHB12029]